MRRNKREVTDGKEICGIIRACKVCRLGILDEGRIYIVPMNFGCECEGGKLTFYFHGAKVGQKMEALKKNPEVGVELDCQHKIVEGDMPCEYGYLFASVIGNGKAELVEEEAEKERALSVIMKHQTGKEFAEFGTKWINAVAVIKVELDSYTCKRHDDTN